MNITRGPENINPQIFQKLGPRMITADEENEDYVDKFDCREVFGTFVFCFDVLWLTIAAFPL